MIFVLFTGYCATGKSSIARAIGDQFSFPLLEERKIAAVIAKNVGFERTRDLIAWVGIERFKELAYLETVRLAKLEGETKGLLIDGCYDPQVPDRIKEDFPCSRVLIVNVTADPETRFRRTVLRSPKVPAEEALRETKFIDRLKETAGLGEMAYRANKTLTNDASFEKVVREMSLYVQRESKLEKETLKFDNLYLSLSTT